MDAETTLAAPTVPNANSITDNVFNVLLMVIAQLANSVPQTFAQAVQATTSALQAKFVMLDHAIQDAELTANVLPTPHSVQETPVLVV